MKIEKWDRVDAYIAGTDITAKSCTVVREPYWRDGVLGVDVAREGGYLFMAVSGLQPASQRKEVLAVKIRPVSETSWLIFRADRCDANGLMDEICEDEGEWEMKVVSMPEIELENLPEHLGW